MRTTTTAFAILSVVVLSQAAVTVHAAKEDHDRLTGQTLPSVQGRESIRNDPFRSPGRPSNPTQPTTDNGNDILLTDNKDSESTNGRTDSGVDGRLHGDPDDCGYFDPIHHHLPCELDVNMTMVKTPAPNDGRDPLTAKPSMQPTPAPVVPTPPTIAPAPVAPSDPSAPPAPSDPSASPTTECTADDGGSFGEIGLVENIVRVEYMYEMELVDGTTPSDVEDDILPSLERTFVDSIIPLLFPDECGTRDGGGSRRRRLNTNYSVRRRLRVVGLSSNPPDEVLGDVSCQAPVSAEIGRTTDTTTCVVVDGEFMFFTDNGNADVESQVALDIMADGMEDGSYADSDPQVVRLTMIDDGSGNGPSPPAQGPTSAPGLGDGENESSTNDDGLRVGLFVGIFGLVAILAGVVFRVTQRNNRNNNEESAMTEPYQADQSQNVSVLTQSMPDDSPPML
mmetsp:Transcript_25026/g.59487  ORF Transcript_25026/g.59487 Transcript_25026/m.59487 type:complete len:451 (+) Transcript_25026:244-1596(+)|eukprot:CAMPEP_0113458814 /NCGR_PEP_ID=MMETSP0014_2-20120614/10118_1 /TAXON_ID=2857 /ORGANISM="Nitzschia sp." /LENGTH=450 /DNA_ID=CAMNT_0000350353 /DNA_START=108 /DNA_END=1460 /DNA_ORIENTATION=- /assembly_acc=CAM_ASM_000159